MICIYHNDLDGQCSAAIILLKYPNCLCIEMDYDRDPSFLFEQIQKNETIFIVDFSFKPDIMELFCKYYDIIWIDHHKTILNHSCNKSNVKGIRDTSKAACELTWNYLNEFLQVPLAVSFIGDYDNWNLKLSDSVHFYLGLQTEYTKPNNKIWEELIINDLDMFNSKFIDQIIQQGKTILAYQKSLSKDFGDSYGFETNFCNYLCFAQNCYLKGSLQFGNKLDKYDICIIFVFNGSEWIVSLYSKTVDVSNIAQVFGGGGHKGAAGFTCKQLPFKKNEEK